jgi:two-component system response regulator NreC
MKLRLVIVDDHAVVRSGLRRVLEAEDDLDVVAEAGDTRNAVFEARAHKPDVIVMDVVMPGRSGIEAIPDVLKEAPDAKVLVLSMQDDPSYVREAFAAGASGYVLKEAEAEERRRAEEDPLTDREREVLRLLALGHTNQEIATMLFISVRTAETHRSHIMRKLGLESRAELVRHALTQGLLDEARDSG